MPAWHQSHTFARLKQAHFTTIVRVWRCDDGHSGLGGPGGRSRGVVNLSLRVVCSVVIWAVVLNLQRLSVHDAVAHSTEKLHLCILASHVCSCRLCAHLYLTTKARRIPRRSCIFMPCDLVLHFQVLHFPVLHFQRPRMPMYVAGGKMSVCPSVCLSVTSSNTRSNVEIRDVKRWISGTRRRSWRRVAAGNFSQRQTSSNTNTRSNVKIRDVKRWISGARRRSWRRVAAGNFSQRQTSSKTRSDVEIRDVKRWISGARRRSCQMTQLI